MRITILLLFIVTIVFSCKRDDSSKLSMLEQIDSLNTALQKRSTYVDSLLEQNKILGESLNKIVSDTNYIYYKNTDKNSIPTKILPIDVLLYIAINYPDYNYPHLSWFINTASSSADDIESILKTTNGNLPWLAIGDYNGDKYLDYVLHIGKGSIPYSGNESYLYTYVILHGSKSGLVEIKTRLNDTWGGQLNCIEGKLVSYDAKTIKKLYPKISKNENIKNSVFLIYSMLSINCYYWDDNQYKRVNLYAD